jgi:hypothetical protein
VRKPPAFQITVKSFEVWQLALGLLAFTVCLTLLAWWWRTQASWVGVCVVVLGPMSVWSLVSLSRVAPFKLRWDTQLWAWSSDQASEHEPQLGSLDVALDFGFWMLLKFSNHDGGHKCLHWLPVQRRGHAWAWHGLRSTVYASVTRSINV